MNLYALARKLRDSVFYRDAGEDSEYPGSTPLLLISHQESDRKTLESMLSETRWKLWSTGSFAAALERLKATRIPIVLCDRDLPQTDWHQLLAAVLSLPSPASVILLSSDGDSSLWRSVIEHGGFDVLTRPLRKSDLIQTLDCAFRLWSQRTPA
jgi:DNA-binding NtrC family response regulator